MAPDASWTLDPGLILAVGAYFAVYAWRWRRSRAPGEPHPPGWGRLAAFAGGCLIVLAALISPVDRLAEQLLVMHMVQHLLLLDIAPILLILGLTKVLLRPATRRLRAIEERAGPLAHPVFAVLAYSAVMWIWHMPTLYDAAAANPAIHVLEHLCFAAAGFLYWWHILSPLRSRMRLGGMGPVMYMVSTKLLVGFLGIALAFAPTAIYSFYTDQPDYWGLTPVADQQLAGLVMALEQSIVMGIVLAILFGKMLAESEREARRAERYGEA